MARGNMRGGRGRGRGGPGAFRGSGGFGRGGPMRGAPRGGRGGFNGPPMGGFDGYDDGYYNYGPPMLPPIPPQRLPLPPLPPVPPRSLMRGMPPARRPPMPPFGGFRHPVPPMPPVRAPRLGFMASMRGRGRGGRVLKIKNVVNGGAPAGFKRGTPAKKLSEKMMNAEIKKPWMTPELEAEIKKKYELFAKTKTTPTDEAAMKAFKDQEAVVTNLNVELRTKHTKAKDAFSCEPCCRGFPSQEALDGHLSEHVTCGIDGCILSAHPRILDVHVRCQHRSGLFRQISGAEAEKWITDRKKRFPTLKTIVEKEQAKAEMEERGETYPTMSPRSTRKNNSCVERNAKSNTPENGQASGATPSIPAHSSGGSHVNLSGERSEPRTRGVKRGGRTKKKRPQRTEEEKQKFDDESEEESGPCFVKMKKFCGLSTLLKINTDQSTDTVHKNNTNNEDTVSCLDKAEDSTIFVGNEKTNVESTSTDNVEDSNACLVESNDALVEGTSNSTELMCNSKEQVNEYKQRDEEVTKMVSDELGEKVVMVQPLNKSMEDNIMCNEPTSSEHITASVGNIEEPIEKIDSNDDALTSLMASYLDDDDEESEMVSDDEGDPPTEIRICKNEADFKLSLNRDESNAHSDTLGRTIADTPEADVEIPDTDLVDTSANPLKESETTSAINSVGHSAIGVEINVSDSSGNQLDIVVDPVNLTGNGASLSNGTNSGRESNRKRQRGKFQARDTADERAKKCKLDENRGGIRQGKTRGDPFDIDTYAHVKTTLRRHRGTRLLEKLLEDDIVHERNVILQCVHHIVKNKFFD